MKNKKTALITGASKGLVMPWQNTWPITDGIY